MLRFLDGQRLAVDDGVGDGSPSGLEQPLDRTPRYIHRLCRLFLMETFVVAEGDRFEFIETDLDDVCLRERDPCRLEQVEAGKSTTGTRLFRSRHGASIELLRKRGKKTSPCVSVHMRIRWRARSRGSRRFQRAPKEEHHARTRWNRAGRRWPHDWWGLGRLRTPRNHKGHRMGRRPRSRLRSRARKRFRMESRHGIRTRPRVCRRRHGRRPGTVCRRWR